METKHIAWFAGLLEGEGYLAILPSGNSTRLVIRLSMTDEDVIRRAYGVFNKGSVTGPYQYKGNKPVWIWSLNNRQDIASILMTIYGMMSIRRQDKIREMLTEWRNYSTSHCGKGHDKKGKRSCPQCTHQTTETNKLLNPQ